MNTTIDVPSLDKYAISETELTRSLCEESFYFFVQEFWDVLEPGEELVCNWHIKYLCDEIQAVAERVFRREEKKYDLYINVPPGTTKSTIASKMFPAWVWTRMAAARIICGSFNYDLSLDLSVKSRYIVNSEKYKRYWPHIQLAADQDTKHCFANTATGMRLATSVGSAPTGRHADFIIVDDPLDPAQAMSLLETTSANNWMDMVIPSRMRNKQVTPIIVIMQRLHQDDPTGHRLEQKDGGAVKHICLPADMNEGYEVKPEGLKNFYTDGLLDPVRLPRKVLEENRVTMGEFAYSGQYGQSPVPLGGAMFLVDRLRIEPPALPMIRTVRYWDKAVSLKKTACFTVGAKLGIDKHNRIYVLDVIRGRWDSDARERIILQAAQLDGYDTLIGIEEEPGSGGVESALATVRNLIGFRVVRNKETQNKVARAEPFSAQVNGGNVTLVPGDWNAIFIDEMRFYPLSTNLDQMDAAAGACNMMLKPVKHVGGWAR